MVEADSIRPDCITLHTEYRVKFVAAHGPKAASGHCLRGNDQVKPDRQMPSAGLARSTKGFLSLMQISACEGRRISQLPTNIMFTIAFYKTYNIDYVIFLIRVAVKQTN